MNLYDVNIYVNAINKESPHHELCRELLIKDIMGQGPTAFSTLALSGFLRVVTNPKILPNPLELDKAMDIVRLFTQSRGALPINPGHTHFTIFTHICQRYGLSGNEIPDAYFAALAIESDCTWVTLDKGFSRFEDLKLKIPVT